MKRINRRQLFKTLKFLSLFIIFGIGIYLFQNGLDSICDSTNGGCATSEILEQNKLSRLSIEQNQVDVRRVIPMQTAGNYGLDFIRYIVPASEVENEIKKCQSDLGELKSSAYPEYPNYRTPKWWPLSKEVEVVNNSGMKVWVSKPSGTFYLYSEWGH